MQTRHRIHFGTSTAMKQTGDETVDLVVTSPPYPMIEMWDETFAAQSPAVARALGRKDGKKAFDAMHDLLDGVWNEVARVLKPGAIACINIGDAVRTLDDRFELFVNHARILSHFMNRGFCALPAIIWRKTTNAPNKFMGSGMMPPGAYVTLEHEYILILRKGNKRIFKSPEEKENRLQSAFFWEERNIWFSDVWTGLIGVQQAMEDKQVRARSAAFPFELAYRLITMFSVKGDRVLDPFLGIGTTTLAAMAAARNSEGYEMESDFQPAIVNRINGVIPVASAHINQRLAGHLDFIASREASGKPLKHQNLFYRFPVMTRQETKLLLNAPVGLKREGPAVFTVTYLESPQESFRKPSADRFVR